MTMIRATSKTMGRARKRQPHFQFPWKHVLNFLLVVFIVNAVIFNFNRFKDSRHFPIKAVKVFGAEHIDRDEAQNFIKPFVDHGFFGVHVDAIKDRLLQEAWVSDVNVRRVWPDQVLINIVEKNPIARWNANSLLSSKGELFAVNSGSYSTALPQFFGPDGKQIYVMQYYGKISHIFNPLHFRIARLELTPELLWNVTLDNGIKLTAGSKDVLTRLSHFVKVYPKIVGERVADVDYVDLRYSSGLAVKWKSIS